MIEDQVRSILVKEIHKLDKLLWSKQERYQKPAISRNQTVKENKSLNFIYRDIEAKLYIFSLLQERELDRFFPPGRVGAELEIC